MTDGGVQLGSEAYDELISEMRTRLEMIGGDDAMTAMGPEGFAPEHIALAVKDALQDWNSIPPPIGDATLVNHPAPGLLRLRTLALLVRGQSQRLAVRGMDFNDSGTVVSDTSRSQLLMRIADIYNQEYQASVRQTKIALNAKRAYGQSASEYAYTGYDYYGW